MGRSWVVVSSLCASSFFAAGCNDSGVLGAKSDPDATPTPTAVPGGAIEFPQAVRGAMWANPDLFPEIPLRVSVGAELDASAVDVRVDDVVVEADEESPGAWVAHVSIVDFENGIHEVEALVDADGETLAAQAELGTGRAGVQLTGYAEDGPANTPRFHRIGSDAVVTWSDRSEGAAIAWARTLDGAGRWSTARVPLSVSALDTTAVRTASGGDGTLGVLRQDLDPGPYVSRFSVVDHTGSELVAPIDLVPAGMYGSWGGDVAWDGSAYVLVWRVNNGSGSSQVRWARVSPQGGLVAGPVVVADAGNDDPHGGFSPQTVVGVRALGGKSLVSFTREYWVAAAGLGIPKSELVWVDADGTLSSLQMPGTAADGRFHWEARVQSLGADELLATWVASDINDDPNPPATIYVSRATAAGAAFASGKAAITSPAWVSDAVVLAHPSQHAVAVWSDERAYAVAVPPPDAQVELYFATLDAELDSSDATRIAHSRLYSGTCEVQTAPAGTNVLVLWRDERTNLYEPELWMETLWY